MDEGGKKEIGKRRVTRGAVNDDDEGGTMGNEDSDDDEGGKKEGGKRRVAKGGVNE